MAACVRCEIVREGEPGIYHCWSRCCRRAYLLELDPLTGKDHNHRRQWVVERLQLLCGLYVDLNPIRAGEVRTPEAALPTSALFRIRTQSLALSLNELLETVRQFPQFIVDQRQQLLSGCRIATFDLRQ